MQKRLQKQTQKGRKPFEFVRLAFCIDTFFAFLQTGWGSCLQILQKRYLHESRGLYGCGGHSANVPSRRILRARTWCVEVDAKNAKTVFA